MNTFLVDLVPVMEQQANPSLAKPMESYMRNQFSYLGIRSPAMAEIHRKFFASHPLPAVNELPEILKELWQLPHREYQYFAVGLLRRMAEMLPEDFIEPIENMIIQKSWWDTVDSIAGGAVGIHFRHHPHLAGSVLPIWRSSSNMWLRRTVLLHQLGYKKQTNIQLLFAVIEENLGSKEFFINKAIGWSLRELSKSDPTAVIEFVNSTPLNPLSKKEALKWLERKGQNDR